jgi:diguanylate cyclase (GGDEF)-like protein
VCRVQDTTRELRVSTPRILITEDEPHLREVLRLQLENAGYDVLEASDGVQALDLAQRELPDLVLLDVMMPEMDGYEACRQLRAQFLTRSIPIIMLTAKVGPAERVQGLEEGANDYVTKPWSVRELMLRIRNALDLSKQQRSVSPLTGLPGNTSIADEITRRLGANHPFTVLQLDIDHFKAFNDLYGYTRGDVAIRTLAHALVEAGRHHGGAATFVGHIGGDDFIVVTSPDHAEDLGEQIISEFDRQVVALYDPADRERGFIEVRNRQHQLERFPLMSVTIAMVSTERMPVSHAAQLLDIAQELKTHGKGIAGSVLVGERRKRPTNGARTSRSAA